MFWSKLAPVVHDLTVKMLLACAFCVAVTFVVWSIDGQRCQHVFIESMFSGPVYLYWLLSVSVISATMCSSLCSVYRATHLLRIEAQTSHVSFESHCLHPLVSRFKAKQRSPNSRTGHDCKVSLHLAVFEILDQRCVVLGHDSLGCACNSTLRVLPPRAPCRFQKKQRIRALSELLLSLGVVQCGVCSVSCGRWVAERGWARRREKGGGR